MLRFSIPAIAMGLLATSLLLVQPAAADTRVAKLTDPAEFPCLGGECTPDIVSATAIYQSALGSIRLSLAFTDPLRPHNGVPAYAVRFVVAQTAAAGHCGNITSTTFGIGGAAGDVFVRGYPYDSTTSYTTATMLVGGYSGSLEVPAELSSDRRTLSYTVTSPAIAQREYRCFEAALSSTFFASEPPVDTTTFVWFDGFAPKPTITEVRASLSGNDATVTAYLDPVGVPTTTRLDLGTSPGVLTPGVPSSPVRASGAVTWTLPGLNAGLTYYFRIIATTEHASALSDEFQIAVPAKPVAEPKAPGVVRVAPALKRLPRVIGKLKVGHRLACAPGRWDEKFRVVAYRWFVGSRRVGTGAVHRVRPAELGRRVSCSVKVRGVVSGKSSIARSSAYLIAPRDA